MPKKQTYFRRNADDSPSIIRWLGEGLTINYMSIVNHDIFEVYLVSEYLNENATYIKFIHKLSSVNL